MENSDAIKEIFGGNPEKGARKEELQLEIDRLEAILSADYRNLWGVSEGGKPYMLSPVEWPDSVMPAIKRVVPNAHGTTVDFEDRTRAADQLAKLKGLYKNDEENKNPLEAIFKDIPRAQLVALRDGLEAMLNKKSRIG